MRWCGAARLWLQHISESIPSKGLQLIILLLSFPLFEASHLFFKGAYLLNQFKLRRLGGENLFLKLYDNPLPRGDIVSVLYGLQNIKSRLEGADPAKYLCDHIARSPNSSGSGS